MNNSAKMSARERIEALVDANSFVEIGGMIIEKLDRLPEDNEEVTLPDRIRLKVQGIDQNRIVKVLLTLPTGDVEEENPDRSETDESK